MADLKCYRCAEWPCACPDGQTIVWGDSMRFDTLLQVGPVDLVLTDAPYGIAHKGHGQIFLDASQIAGDADTRCIEFFDQWCASRCAFASFFSPYKPPPVKWRSILVWDKGAHVGGGGDAATCWKRDAELIGVKGNWPLLGTRDSCVLKFNACLPPPTGHFCEKPIGLMKYLVSKFSEPKVLDPFMGSGTTLVACKALGKRAIGIELDQRWCEIAANRLRQGVLDFGGDAA